MMPLAAFQATGYLYSFTSNQVTWTVEEMAKLWIIKFNLVLIRYVNMSQSVPNGQVSCRNCK